MTGSFADAEENPVLNPYSAEVSVSAAPAGGGPVADGGGVRQGVDAEEVSVSQR